MSNFFYTTSPDGRIQYQGRIVSNNADGSGTHIKFSAATDVSDAAAKWETAP